MLIIGLPFKEATMKILFMGTPTFSVPILEALAEKYPVCGVVTQPDKPVGRKKVLTPPPVKQSAEALNIPVFQPRKIKEDYQSLIDLKADCIVTAAYGQIIPKALLDAPEYGAINIHASLLPKLRGGAPIQRAIERRHKETGITIMKMSTRMDAGDIYKQKALPINERETSETLFPKLSLLGRDMIIEVLPEIFAKTLHATPQNEEEATYAYNIKPEEEYLDFNQAGEDLDAKIRAFYPEPNTYTYLHKEKLKVIQAEFFNCESFFTLHGDKENGQILKIIDDGIGVKTPTGALMLKVVQLQGKKAMPVKDFMNGAGKHKVFEGMVLKKPH